MSPDNTAADDFGGFCWGQEDVQRRTLFYFLLMNGQIFLLQTSSPQISVKLLIDEFLANGNCKLIAAEMASEDKYSAGCLQGECTEETLNAIFGALSLPLTVFLIFISP